VHLVDELPKRVQRLVPGIRPHPLQSLYFVEHDEQASVPGIPQHGEQALEEPQRPEVVEVAAYSRGPAGGGGHVWLPAQPGQDRRGGRLVISS
jgi:hypothetical protein